MVQLVLEGDTLGKRHRHYNCLLKQALAEKKSIEPEKLKNEDNDLDNLLKIDIASNQRNVEYILEVLKSEDMLYVSRAIKRTAWLITEPQYAHIINPDYLHTQLFPQMTTKACNKLILHVRLNLKDQTRVETFYNYIKNKNEKEAHKWLPHCSLSFIEKEVEKVADKIELSILERLCSRSITILETYIKKQFVRYRNHILNTALFLINVHPEKYLDIVESVDFYEMPNFNAKFTNALMNKCPDRIINKFDKYYSRVHLETFVKHLKQTDIKPFLLKYVDNESMRYWFKFDNLKLFIRRMPKEGRFDFLKKVFIEKVYKSDTKESNIVAEDVQFCCAMTHKASTKSDNVYNWYRFATFEVALPELKKLIRNESLPTERNAILEVLISCAGRNLQHVHTLLQYYHDKHINEPFKFKIQFVNTLISHTDTHVFDDKTWSLLNNIFCSLEVYTETENNVQNCIQAIIVYKILHYERVPEIIEKKFTFHTMKSIEHKLNKEEKDKIFSYLFNILVNKIQNKNIQNEIEFTEVINLLESILNLLLDWKKELLDYPWVCNKIKTLANIKQTNSWSADISKLYNKNKLWRKHMFEDSLLLSPTEQACFNALKHDPELLVRHKSEVEALCRNDKLSLRRLLSNIRIYWPETLANEWAEAYLARLTSPGGHRALVRGLCALLPLNQLLDIVKQHAPTETKITWSEDDDLQLSLCKQFAKNVYLARPMPPPEAVLPYAKGDYLQFALSSLNAILYNMSAANSREHIKMFLDAPVSLQKHGIRLAFTKLKSQEIRQIFSDIWSSTKNSTIRAVLFKQTFNLLCKEKKSTLVDEMWELLSMFIDNLSQDEDKTIYELLGNADNVPLPIRPKYCMRSYKYLKSLPAKANCEGIIENIVSNTIRDIMEFLDADFVADILLEYLNKRFTKKYHYVHIISAYLLCAKDVKSQTERYEKVFVPFLERSLDSWNIKTDDDSYFFRSNLNDLLKKLSLDVQSHVFEKNMVFPAKLFTDILTLLEEKLPMQNNYIMLRTWKLTACYVTLLESQKTLISTLSEGLASGSITPVFRKDCWGNPESDTTWEKVYENVASEFTVLCLKYLKDDIETYFPTIYLLFAKALGDMFNDYGLNQLIIIETLKAMLRQKDFIESYLMVLKLLPYKYLNSDISTQKAIEIRKMIRSHSSAEIKMHYYKKFNNCDLDNENI